MRGNCSSPFCVNWGVSKLWLVKRGSQPEEYAVYIRLGLCRVVVPNNDTLGLVEYLLGMYQVGFGLVENSLPELCILFCWLAYPF